MKLSLRWLNRSAVRAETRAHRTQLRGFSLVELSVTVTILAIVATFGLEGMASFIDRTNGQVTKERLGVADETIRNYFRIYGRLPCPADRTLLPSDANYGRESCTIGVASGPTVGGGIMFGAVPFRTLNLPINHSVDGWNNKLNYVVTKNLTLAGDSAGQFGETTAGKGGIEIRAGKLEQASSAPYCGGTNCQVIADPAGTTGAAYVVFSNGSNQRGAISMYGLNRADCAEANSNDKLKIDTQNCLNDGTGTISTSADTPANAAVTAAIPPNVFYDSKFNNGLSNLYFFDDYVVWRPRGQL